MRIAPFEVIAGGVKPCQVIVRVGVSGLDLQGLFIMLNGFRKKLLFGIRSASRRWPSAVAGSCPERLRRPAAPSPGRPEAIRHTQRQLRFRRARTKLHRLAIFLDRFVKLLRVT